MTGSLAVLAVGTPGGTAVVYPASTDILWTSMIVAVVAAFALAVVTVLRSALSDRAKLLWLVLIVVLPPVGIIGWAVLGHDARRSRARRPRGRGTQR
ncbi:PLDc N-terminal domain-containing protein [Frigoribacterium faeni]|uniref:Gpi18-like mannosyltransferase n=1 Tax=Frigoribacterium faeni TaxID=145483 RepID=A0A7W3PJG9_9MICO|nr:PLDc N-terminal domain-containing protein [Frigoribacterium faeni]MBA8813822.1 Gpi18-like mannosyltransferase [Frigoribacterium faeni]BFF15140.1 hypothetical protein GCM10025699_64430 [Microbacterium flavescens]GEK82204.1 hypothetical protein FFA01_05130 [Frigoribacterium faeni]